MATISERPPTGLLELRDLRKTLHEQAGEILLAVERAHRQNLTADEDAALKRIYGEMDQLTTLITAREKQEDYEAALAMPAPRIGERLWGPAEPGEPGHSLVASPAFFGVGPREPFQRSLKPASGVGEGLSFGGLVRAMVAGPRTAAERRALSEGLDSGGGVTVPSIVLQQFVDRLRANIVCIRAGAVTIPLESDQNTIARLTTDPTVMWRLENQVINETDPVFDGLTLVPRWLGCITRVSRELLMDSLNVDQMLTTAFTGSMALEVDRAALMGTGTPPEPRGIVNTTGVGAVAVTASLKYDDLLSALAVLGNSNAAPATGMIMSPTNYYNLAKLKGQPDGQFLAPPLVVMPPMHMTTSLPNSTVVTGNFAELYFGFRAELRIELLRELFASNFQHAFLVWLRFDVGLAHPASFVKITGIV
jgi:HK97 family phage major capsid protein